MLNNLQQIEESKKRKKQKKQKRKKESIKTKNQTTNQKSHLPSKISTKSEDVHMLLVFVISS